MEYRNKDLKETKKKFNLIKKTNCAIYSLKEVESFLHNLDKASRFFYLYNFFK